MSKHILIGFVVITILALVGYAYRAEIASYFFRPTASNSQTGAQLNSAQMENIEVVATDLEIPWEIAWLPDQSILITERTGALVRLLPNSRQKISLTGVHHQGEGGLLGLALHPQFAENHWVYVYLTTKNNQGITNRVERYELDVATNQLSQQQVIIDQIPGAANHDGGRIVFGPDTYLYITTGDAGQSKLAQDQNSLAGKILRVKDDGSLPTDNPWQNAVYSLGHRNPQGLAWDSQGQLWSTEHGPSGPQTGNDEINLITSGGNYGWPVIKGQQNQTGMITPVRESGSQETWAPGGLTIVGQTLIWPGLRGQSIYTSPLADNTIAPITAHFATQFGRLRTVAVDPTGQWLYVTTSNTDGRGTSSAADDKLIRIPLSLILPNSPPGSDQKVR